MSPPDLIADDDCQVCAGTGYDPQSSTGCRCLRVGDQPITLERALVAAFSGKLPNPVGFRMEVGKHTGELISRVPVGYLRWMVNTSHTNAAYAEAELRRRGTAMPDVEVTAHAVDRASLRLLDAWRESRAKKEGLHTWLARMAARALQNPPFRQDCHQHIGIVFVFTSDGIWPVLKSVWPTRQYGATPDDEEEDYAS